MVLVPNASADAFRFRVATPFDPEDATATTPSVVFPRTNVTLPVGAVVPVAGLIVADSVVLALVGMLGGVATSVSVVLMLAGKVVHCVISLLTSTEPNPVTRS